MTSGNLIIGVTGSIGCILVPHYVYAIRQALNVNVRIVMTAAAQKFVTPYTLEIFAGGHVFTDSFEMTSDVRVPHIELARWADVILVLPATANIIAKTAHGLCDDLLSTLLLARKRPTFFAPSMNEEMWENVALQQNLRILADRGNEIINPAHGYEVSDMSKTFGAIPPPQTVIDLLQNYFGERVTDDRKQDIENGVNQRCETPSSPA
jgi:phosphopantothenoylcysteine synthetase/decarboxylase